MPAKVLCTPVGSEVWALGLYRVDMGNVRGLLLRAHTILTTLRRSVVTTRVRRRVSLTLAGQGLGLIVLISLPISAPEPSSRKTKSRKTKSLKSEHPGVR